MTPRQFDGWVEVTRRNGGKSENANSAGASTGALKSYPPVGTQRTGKNTRQGTNHLGEASGYARFPQFERPTEAERLGENGYTRGGFGHPM